MGIDRSLGAGSGGMVGSIVVMPEDVRQLQKQVGADLAAVRSSLQACATAGTFTEQKTPVEWNAWQSMKTRAEAFLAEVPSFLSSANQYERGEAVQKELATWHEKAKAFGCDAGPAPNLPADTGLSSLFAGVSTTALLVIAALFFLRQK
jgi:hypothetical protein